MEQKALEKKDLKTLTACIATLQKEGFIQNFMVNEKGLYGIDSEKAYAPEEVIILNFYRFEGASDPADSSILYAVETDDGTRGLLSDAYGPEADTNVTAFITLVENITKKTAKGEKL